MPPDRPKRALCYFNKDQNYLTTLQKLTKGIVIQPPNDLIGKLSLDQVAQTVAASAKVTASQLQVTTLSNDRFLVILPSMLDRDEMVSAIPKRVWDEGFKFHTYSPMMDASISIPIFKVWIDIHGIPLELGTDAHFARMVNSFGIYLGAMESPTYGDYRTYSLFVATDDLSLIPHSIDLRVGGMVFTATVFPRKWLHNPVFQRTDLLPMMTSYHPPVTPPTPPLVLLPPTQLVNHIWIQDDDVMPMSLKALREIFKDFNPADLPADLAACLSGDSATIAANHATYRDWNRQNRPAAYYHEDRQNRQATSLELSPPHKASPPPASADPPRPAWESQSPPTHTSLPILLDILIPR